MPRGRYVLRRQARGMVYEVLKFMKKEAEAGLQYDLKCVQKRTAAATGISERTVRRIATAANDPSSNLVEVFRTPGKKRAGKRRVTGIDNCDQGVIKRVVHNFHITEKELPTLGQLLKKLKELIKFEGSASSLRRILKDLGFKWKKTEDNRRVLIEHTSIRLKRIEYLKKLAKYRSEGRPIIYTDTTSRAWSDSSKVLKGQRVVIMHAGYEAGFIPNALLMFKGGTKTGDYHNNVNYENYENWICTQLMPSLPPNSVVVIDNAPYHNKLEDAPPTSNSKKTEMISWLIEKDIPCNPNMFKPELYKLIHLHKERYKKYHVDRILQQNNHTILRLPPYHPDLNPIEMVWKEVKEFVAKKNIDGNINNLMKLVEEKVNTMGENEWSVFCDKVMHIEEEYTKSDIVIDNLTDKFIIHVSENESEEDSSISEDDDSLSDEEHMSDEEPSKCDYDTFILEYNIK